MVILGSMAGGVIGPPRSISSVHLGETLLQLQLRAGSSRCQVESQHSPCLPGPGKRSLRTDAQHLVLGEDEGFVGPLPGAALTPPVHAVSAHPELVKINRAIIPLLTATQSIYAT